MPDPHMPLDYATPAPRRSRSIAWIVAAVILFLLVLGVGGLFVTGRQVTVVVAPPPGAAPRGARPAITPPAEPVRVTLVQRREQPLPGSNGTILVHIGDITGGQTLLTVQDGDGQALVHTVSVRAGDVQTFTLGTATFEIELLELKNFLVGDDFAVFEIRPPAPPMSEAEKIERLIDAVAGASDITFIRNGAEHSPADAAAHLRRKYSAAASGSPITARQFIDEIAGESSLSGEAYRVRLPDGREITSREWLQTRLQSLRPRAASTSPSQ